MKKKYGLLMNDKDKYETIFFFSFYFQIGGTNIAQFSSQIIFTHTRHHFSQHQRSHSILRLKKIIFIFNTSNI